MLNNPAPIHWYIGYIFVGIIFIEEYSDYICSNLLLFSN
jgi:hypothetical protein